jgi:hypothetical protein
MKKSILTIVALSLFLVSFNSCSPAEEEDECPLEGYGLLEIRNKSTSTVHRIIIDGINYGTIDPKGVATFPLRPGKHDVQSVGISGGNGCSPAQIFIVECGTERISCSS